MARSALPNSKLPLQRPPLRTKGLPPAVSFAIDARGADLDGAHGCVGSELCINSANLSQLRNQETNACTADGSRCACHLCVAWAACLVSWVWRSHTAQPREVVAAGARRARPAPPLSLMSLCLCGPSLRSLTYICLCATRRRSRRKCPLCSIL